jgi:hypothetical protein
VKTTTAVLCLLFSFLCAAAQAATECTVNFPACAATSERIGPGGQVTTIGDGLDTGWFDGYVMGVSQATLQKAWCPIRPFSGNQVSAVVSKFIRDHPEMWGERPFDLVQLALGQAFPCPKKKGS